MTARKTHIQTRRKSRHLGGVRNVRIRGRKGLVDLAFQEDGTIAAIGPRLRFASGAKTLDGGGGLALASFVDAHLHLDLAYSIDVVAPNKSGTLLEAIGHWDAAKKKISAENVRERAIRGIEAEVGYGTGHIRTHVDVGTSAGLRLVEGVLAARETCRNLADVQVTVFPQDGIIKDPGAYEQMRAGIQMGCDLVGGIAHNERTDDDSKRHIEKLFELACEFDVDIDCHIDESDNPNSRCTEYLAAKTIEYGRQGRVTASHVCALASYDNVHAKKVIDLLAAARVHVVTNPQVNMHLQGRFDRYPKRRGLTRVSELLAAGVNVACGQDCIRDPFYPLGTGQMLDVAHMLVHADHLSTPRQIEQAMDAITINGARALRTAGYGLKVGGRADLVVLPTHDVPESLRLRPFPRLVIKGGRVVAGEGR